jgi:hypothetical protein
LNVVCLFIRVVLSNNEFSLKKRYDFANIFSGSLAGEMSRNLIPYLESRKNTQKIWQIESTVSCKKNLETLIITFILKWGELMASAS